MRIFKLPICRIVNVAIEFWVGEDTLDHFMRVVEPNLVFCDLPLWRVRCRFWSIIAQAEAFPRNIPKWDGVNFS